MVGTAPELIDMGANSSEFLVHAGVEAVDLRELVVTPCDARLVRDHEGQESSVVDPAHCRPCPGNPAQLLGPVGVAPVMVQRTVAVEKHGWPPSVKGHE